MKKITALLLVLVLIIGLTACSGSSQAPVEPETVAFEAYVELLERMSFEAGQSGAYDIDITMEMEMHFLGEVIDSFSSGNMQMVVDGDRAEVQMILETDMSQMGLPNMVMEIYMLMDGEEILELGMYIDGVDFADVFPADMLEDMIDSMIDEAANMPEFDYTAISSATIVEADGTREIHMVLDGEMLGSFITQAMEDQLAMFDELGDIELEFGFEDIIMIIVEDSQGNPISMTMDMGMTMVFGGELAELDDIAGEEMRMRTVTTFVFNGFGDSVQIQRV